MRRKVRLIGGSHGGETFVTDRPVICLPCLKHVDFGPPIGPPADVINAEIETYRVEEYRYASGHSHRYGRLEPMRLVDAMNVMWNAYQDSIKEERKR